MFPVKIDGYSDQEYVLEEGTYRQHIVPNHGEMIDSVDKIVETVESPELSAPSKYDNDSELLYREFDDFLHTYVCVVIDHDAQRVVTAYGTGQPKPQASTVS